MEAACIQNDQGMYWGKKIDIDAKKFCFRGGDSVIEE